jgi:hypothetical protein
MVPIHSRSRSPDTTRRLLPQVGGREEQIAPPSQLGRAGLVLGQRESGRPRLLRRRRVAGADQQLGAGGVPERVALQPDDGVDRREAADGPSRSATAAARLSATTGVPAIANSTSYQDTTAAQSVSAQVGASA